MGLLRVSTLLLVGTAHAVVSNPFDAVKGNASASTDALQVDLGYEIYKGVTNSTLGINTFRGIRFAAAPTGNLRWQAPTVPNSNRSSVLDASSFGPACPQTGSGGKVGQSIPGSSEDCLFLSVYAPRNASKLPVMVWVHGGGYGQGLGSEDLTNFVRDNENGLVGVAIQYRLGAFGFLAGDEVHRNGVVNAGLLDQHFALQWVQAYIEKFGGDPKRVTIAGVSAGAGSVMLQDIAYGGDLGTSLFTNSIAASPFLPQQYGYKDWIPSQNYYAFATAAGCPPQWAYGNSSQTIFECLVSQDTSTLQEASEIVSTSGTFGTWAFLPVTDGTFIQSTPTEALTQGKTNGLNLLTGNNAEEGRFFVTPNITTENDLLSWIHLVFPLFTSNDTSQLLSHYPLNDDLSADTPFFATNGESGLTATDISQTARGQQQRANNIYAETTFVCPSYWLAESYSSSGTGSGYKYQFSVVNAVHGADTAAVFNNPPGPNRGPDFVRAFSHIWGNFIIHNNPSISSEIANGAQSNNASASALENWPRFTAGDKKMVNLNQTGGELVPTAVLDAYFMPTLNVSTYQGEGLRNDLRVVDAGAWEGGRGARCEFWKSVAERVPE
ncbi:alpha/beta-hydrolase [Periconia macrospinosa]|uniref:Carboxylic ester hydrolase n=1 Tax=Periconia macrospinosa TaxID=97972 RepID=A0A2V1DUQ7_9PLEO|nr:alpha/beta-hydrolase [Periconia macrospinosa]